MSLQVLRMQSDAVLLEEPFVYSDSTYSFDMRSATLLYFLKNS